MHSLAAAAAAAAYRKKKRENAKDGKLQTLKTNETFKKKRPRNLHSLKTTQHLKHEVKCLETS